MASNLGGHTASTERRVGFSEQNFSTFKGEITKPASIVEKGLWSEPGDPCSSSILHPASVLAPVFRGAALIILPWVRHDEARCNSKKRIKLQGADSQLPGDITSCHMGSLWTWWGQPRGRKGREIRGQALFIVVSLGGDMRRQGKRAPDWLVWWALGHRAVPESLVPGPELLGWLW